MFKYHLGVLCSLVNTLQIITGLTDEWIQCDMLFCDAASGECKFLSDGLSTQVKERITALFTSLLYIKHTAIFWQPQLFSIKCMVHPRTINISRCLPVFPSWRSAGSVPCCDWLPGNLYMATTSARRGQTSFWYRVTYMANHSSR